MAFPTPVRELALQGHAVFVACVARQVTRGMVLHRSWCISTGCTKAKIFLDGLLPDHSLLGPFRELYGAFHRNSIRGATWLAPSLGGVAFVPQFASLLLIRDNSDHQMSHQTKHIMPLSFSLLIAGTNGAQAVNPQSQEQDAQPPPSAGRRQGQGPGDQRGRPLFGKITAINANSLELAVLA